MKTRMHKYIVEEVIRYEVIAHSAQEAIDMIIHADERDSFPLAVTGRDVVGGPPGWENEDYVSP